MFETFPLLVSNLVCTHERKRRALEVFEMACRQTQKEAKAAERERDRQRRKDKGLLGGIGDTLSER
jgi:hypothetical protein